MDQLGETRENKITDKINNITSFEPPLAEPTSTSTKKNIDSKKDSDTVSIGSSESKQEDGTVYTEVIAKIPEKQGDNLLLKGGNMNDKDEDDQEAEHEHEDKAENDNKEEELINDKMHGGKKEIYESNETDDTEDIVSDHLEDKDIEHSDDQDDLQLLDGGAPVVTIQDYKISYLADDDEKLVNPEKIKSAVKKYIDNFNSESIKKYKQLFKNVYQKYSNKRYRIDNNEDEIIVLKESGTNQKKPEIVFEVNKPGYIFYNKDHSLLKLKQRISNKRQELQLHYQKLVNKLEVTPEEKKQFEKERKTFIDMLEKYYIFNVYHQQINNISTEGKTSLLIQQIEGIIKENNERGVTLVSNVYSIDNTLIDNINANNSNRFNNYNELIAKLKGTKLGPAQDDTFKKKTTQDKQSDIDATISKEPNKEKAKTSQRKKIIEEIKEYLKSQDELHKIQSQIEQSVKHQNNYVDYIINKLPNND